MYAIRSYYAIFKFIKNNYHTDQIVFCSIGSLSIKKVIKLAEKYFGSIKPNLRTNKRGIIEPSEPRIIEIQKDTYQSHIVIGTTAYDSNHPQRLGLHLLNNLLGGPGMNSRLNLALREKKGIAYNIESNYSPLFGTGVFSIYYGTDQKNIDRSLKIVHAELKKLKEKTLGSMQLHKAKRQLKGQIAISSENKESLLLNLGKSYLLYDKVDSLQYIYKKIDSLSASRNNFV